MNLNDNDQPLGQQFRNDPYGFLQSFIRNMNNQIFLSQYQINHLYALLLLKKQSPWDQLKPSSLNLSKEVQQMVNKKIGQVKKILQALSQVYEDKVKKTAFNQIERLMNIIKAKNKSIFIEKDMSQMHHHLNHIKNVQGKQIKSKIISEIQSQNSPLFQSNNKKPFKRSNEQQNSQNLQNKEKQFSENNQNKTEIKKLSSEKQNTECQTCIQFQCNYEDQKKPEEKDCQISKIQPNNSQKVNQFKQQGFEEKQQENQNCKFESILSNQTNGDDREVMSLFYGIANLPNLSSLALGNTLQYSTSERYIKFKMSKNYIMTIKNQDEQSFDRISTLKNVSSDLFTHHIFPYLTAVELFKARSVCREWMENVKEAWHSTFKRQMFIQLMACQFCKEIQHNYKLIQLRNPFFQKISLLMHALLQIIQWQKVYQSVINNTIVPQLKKVLIILLKLLGQNINTPNLNSITQDLWLQNKQKVQSLKQRLSQFLTNFDSSKLNIKQLHEIKLNLLDDPFMRLQQLQSQDKTPLLLVIFIKQMTLQQILKNHIFFSQQYLMNTKRKLDNVSSKMPQQKGFLEGVYKILLLRNLGGKGDFKQDEQQRSEMPNFQDLLGSIFSSKSQMNKPDFVIKSRSSSTSIYMDKGTKFDIIMSTVRKMSAVTQILRQPTVRVSEQEGMQIQQGISAKIGQKKQGQMYRTEIQSKQDESQSNRTQRIEQMQQAQIQEKRDVSRRNAARTQKKELQRVNIYNYNINLNNKQGQINEQQKKQRKQEEQYEGQTRQ